MKRQQALMVAGGLVALVAYHQLLYAPLQVELATAVAATEGAEKRLRQVRILQDLQVALAPMLEASVSEGNLLSRLEERLERLEVRKQVARMGTIKPRKGSGAASAVEEAAQVQVERLDMRQLVALLGELDRLERSVWVRKMVIRLAGENEASLQLELEKLATD